jgi:hypothetical protein
MKNLILGLATVLPMALGLSSARADGDDAHPRRPAEIFAVLGAGNAVCDDTKPSNQCAVKGGAALGLGGAWRLHPHWAIGGELAFWSYKVREEWKGTLTDPATDVKLTSFYVAPFARWYWFGHGITDAYLQGGIGFGAFHGKASNAGGTYDIDVTGIVYPFAIGADWYLSTHFRLGVQALAYLQKSRKVCETTNGNEACKDATNDQNALPWRIVAVGTFTLGDP